jgi:hypothetical protein
MFNPVFTPSKLELGVIRDYVYEGGHLIINSSGDKFNQIFYPLLKKLKLDLAVEEDKNFKNGVVSYIENDFYSASFYGLYNFKDCHIDKFSCYFYEKTLGKGKISIILGVLPFSNIMLQKEGNLNFLETLLGENRSILIDEFHHYFGAKSEWDLLTEPKLAFTIIIIFLIVIVFFLFSYVPKSLLSPRQKRMHYPNIHHFTLDLVLGAKESDLSLDLINKHKKFIMKEFDVSSEELKSIKTSSQLVKFHKKKLENK